MSVALLKAQRKIREWRDDPVKFVVDNFQTQPDAWQVKALRALASEDRLAKRICMTACVGPGKSTLLAWAGWYFLSCYSSKGEHPKGAAVSVTADNLKDNLWPELSKWQTRSEFLSRSFAWTKSRIFSKDHPETWFFSARSWSKTANAEEQGRTLSGIHSKYVLFLIDESGEIPLPVLKAAEQALSNCTWGKILQAGNPSSLEGILYAAATKLRHLWTVIRITGDPDDPERSPRIDIEWAREQITTYGRTNPWIMYSILGLFPPSSINSILGVEEVEASMRLHLTEDLYVHSQKRLGVDCARFGDDQTIIYPRQGLASFKYVDMRNARSNEIASRVILAKSRWGSEVEFVDDTGGYGAGVIDSMIQGGYSPTPINFSGKADDPRYLNKRAEMLFRAAEWVKRGGALAYCPQLLREMTTTTYTFNNGKFQIIDKALIKKNLGFSPDRFDALGLTFAQAEMPATIQIPGLQGQSKLLSEYDPLSPDRN
jgi:phage terminase large subunit